MGCASSSNNYEITNLVSQAPLPKGHKYLVELAFLSEVQKGWRTQQGAPEHLAWIAALGDGSMDKYMKEIVHTSSKRKELEEAGTTPEAFKEWVDKLWPAVDEGKISPYALQITWEVGQHANVAHGELARF